VIVIPTMGERRAEPITSKSGGKGVNVLIDFTYNVVNADKPEDRFEVKWIGEASDYGDKATNKAATAALKYYLMRQFNISEKGDDPDAETIDRGVAAGSPAAGVAPQNADKPISDAQKKKIYASLGSKGFTADEQKVIVHRWAKVDSTNDLTLSQASDLIEKIEATDKETIAKLLHESATADQFKEMSDVIKGKLGDSTSRESVLAIVRGISLEDNPAKLTKGRAADVIEVLREADKDALLAAGMAVTSEAPTTEEAPTRKAESGDTVITELADDEKPDLSEIPF
jgi:hypothetical protein